MSSIGTEQRVGKWLEEFGCGCTHVTELKCDRLTYCPRHGEDALRIYKLDSAVPVGLSK